LEQQATAAGLCLIHFLAPTSSPERVAMVTARAQGFIYLVSLIGVTGARQQVQGNLADFVARVRAQTKIPLAVGFGIGTPAQAREVGALADGVIVGSKLINVADAAEDKPTAVATFVRSLQEALNL
jgi:tryptophan synthase alpha chain